MFLETTLLLQTIVTETVGQTSNMVSFVMVVLEEGGIVEDVGTLLGDGAAVEDVVVFELAVALLVICAEIGDEKRRVVVTAKTMDFILICWCCCYLLLALAFQLRPWDKVYAKLRVERRQSKQSLTKATNRENDLCGMQFYPFSQVELVRECRSLGSCSRRSFGTFCSRHNLAVPRVSWQDTKMVSFARTSCDLRQSKIGRRKSAVSGNATSDTGQTQSNDPLATVAMPVRTLLLGRSTLDSICPSFHCEQSFCVI